MRRGGGDPGMGPAIEEGLGSGVWHNRIRTLRTACHMVFQESCRFVKMRPQVKGMDGKTCQ